MRIKGERRERVQCNEKRREESADNVEKSEIMKIRDSTRKDEIAESVGVERIASVQRAENDDFAEGV